MIIRITTMENDRALVNLAAEAEDRFTLEEVERVTGLDFPLTVNPSVERDPITNLATGKISETGTRRSETGISQNIKNAIQTLTTYDDENTREYDAKSGTRKA